MKLQPGEQWHVLISFLTPGTRIPKVYKRVLYMTTCLAFFFICFSFLFRGATKRERDESPQNDRVEFEKLLYYVQHPSTLCRTALSLGGVLDGSKERDGDKIICQEPGAPLRSPCIVYSFGGNDEWSFEESVEKFGCQVFTFDPSLNKTSYRRSENIMFYPIGISHTNEDKFLLKGMMTWNVRTLEFIVEKLGHKEETIDILKLDIEGDEWEVLDQLISSNGLERVHHLCVEVHLNSMDWYHKLKILQKLESEAGFHFFSSRKNLVTPPKKVPGIPNRYEPLFYELAWFRDVLEPR